MARTMTELVDNIAQVYSHPSGLQVVTPPGQGTDGCILATTVAYDEPLSETLNDLAGRTMAALVALAAVSGAADYDRDHPGDATTEHDLTDVCMHAPVTLTTLAELQLQLDPVCSAFSVQDLRTVLCSIAGSSIQVDYTPALQPSDRTRTRFIAFTYFGLEQNKDVLGWTLRYTCSHPVWALAHP